MRRIGIVGGVGWQSTVEYYAGLCQLSEQRPRTKKLRRSPLTPEICIESLDLATAVSLLGDDEKPDSWRRFDEYHRTALQRLQASDVEVAVIASNTPHHRFGSITHGIAIPVLSIVDASAREAVHMGVSRALILGTAMTMQSRMYPQLFSRYGIAAWSPSKAKTRTAVEKLIKDLHQARVRGTAERIHQIAEEALDGPVPHEVAVCLACTELPLGFPSARHLASFERNGVRYLNTTATHIRALFDFATA